MPAKDASKITNDTVEEAEVTINLLVLGKFFGLVRSYASLVVLQEALNPSRHRGGSADGRHAVLQDDANRPVPGKAGKTR